MKRGTARGDRGKAANLSALGRQLVDRDLGGFSREPGMWRWFEREKVH